MVPTWADMSILNWTPVNRFCLRLFLISFGSNTIRTGRNDFRNKATSLNEVLFDDRDHKTVENGGLNRCDACTVSEFNSFQAIPLVFLKGLHIATIFDSC